jgi:hypothetical protein
MTGIGSAKREILRQQRQNSGNFAQREACFEIFEIIATVVGYIAYEWKICFCCEVAIPKVLIDTSASQTIS